MATLLATLLATVEAPLASTAVATSHADAVPNSVARMRVLAEEKRILALEVQLIEAELKLRRIDRIMTEINCQMAADELKREERQLVDLEISLIEAQIAVKTVDADMKELSADIPEQRVAEIVNQVYQEPISPIRWSPKRTIRKLMPGTGENALPPAPLGSSTNPPKSLLKGKMATILSRFEREIGKNEEVGCQSKSFVSVAVGQAMRFTRPRGALPMENVSATPTAVAESMVLPDPIFQSSVEGGDFNEYESHESSHDVRIPLSEQLTIPQTPNLDHDEKETLIEVVDDDDDDNWTVHSYAVSLIHSRKAREDDDLVSLKSELHGLKHELSSIRRAEIQAEVDAGDDYDVDDELSRSSVMPTSLLIQPSESCLLHHSKRQLRTSNLNNSSSSFLEFSFSSIATEEVFQESFVGSYVASLSSRSPRQRSNPSLGGSILELELEDEEDEEEEGEDIKDETSRSGSYMASSEGGGSDDGDGAKDDCSFSLSCDNANIEVSSVGSTDLHDQLDIISPSKSVTKRIPSRMVSMLNSVSLQSALFDEFDEAKYDEDDDNDSEASCARKDTCDYGYEEHEPSIRHEEVNYGYEDHEPSARAVESQTALEPGGRPTHSVKSGDDEDSVRGDREDSMPANIDYGYEGHEPSVKEVSEGEESENWGRPICHVADHPPNEDSDEEDPEDSMLAFVIRKAVAGSSVDYGYEDHEPSTKEDPEEETETEVSEHWGMPAQLQEVLGQDDGSSDDESGNDYINPLLMTKGSLKQTVSTPLQRAASSRKLAVEDDDLDELGKFREVHEMKGFKSITSEAASLGRLTRLKEHVTETQGQKQQKRGNSRRASIVASSLLDIQWKSSHHNFTREVSEIAAVYQRSEHVVTSHTRKSVDSDESGLDDFFGDYETSASESDGDGGLREQPSRVDAVVKQCKEDNEKNSKMVQHLQDMEDPDDVELPEDRAPQTQSIIRQRQRNPRALRRCSIGTITRTLTEEAISSAQERQARIDQGQFHMKGQCSCPYCFTASPFQTYAYMEQEQKREDKAPPGTWSRQNGKWGRHRR
jgi:hypothetical protein